jgi:hypothetical protein
MAALPAVTTRAWGSIPHPSPRVPGSMMLRKGPDGACVHLGPNGCTVHRHRPRACRIYDCRISAAAGLYETHGEAKHQVRSGYASKPLRRSAPWQRRSCCARRNTSTATGTSLGWSRTPRSTHTGCCSNTGRCCGNFVCHNSMIWPRISRAAATPGYAEAGLLHQRQGGASSADELVPHLCLGRRRSVADEASPNSFR